MYIVIDYTNLGYMGRNIILKHWFQLLKKSLLCCLRFVLLPIQCHWTARSCLAQVILELKGKYWPISSRLEIKSSFLYQFCTAVIVVVFFRRLPDFQKHPTRGVLRKSCSENMQQIYRKTPMLNWSHCELIFYVDWIWKLSSYSIWIKFKPKKLFLLVKFSLVKSSGQIFLKKNLVLWFWGQHGPK